MYLYLNRGSLVVLLRPCFVFLLIEEVLALDNAPLFTRQNSFSLPLCTLQLSWAVILQALLGLYFLYPVIISDIESASVGLVRAYTHIILLALHSFEGLIFLWNRDATLVVFFFKFLAELAIVCLLNLPHLDYLVLCVLDLFHCSGLLIFQHFHSTLQLLHIFLNLESYLPRLTMREFIRLNINHQICSVIHF